MRLSPPLLSLLCAAPLLLSGCDFGDDTQGPDDMTPDGGTSPDGGSTDTANTPFAREMISAHNSVRISATPTPNPSLPILTWSNDVAAVAQAWADMCRFEHNTGRGNLGENILIATPNTVTTAGVVQNWASEAASYDYGRNACAPGKQCGHYTQIVWRSTTPVGCATKVCPPWQLWVCNYSPPGNYLGQRPY